MSESRNEVVNCFFSVLSSTLHCANPVSSFVKYHPKSFGFTGSKKGAPHLPCIGIKWVVIVNGNSLEEVESGVNSDGVNDIEELLLLDMRRCSSHWFTRGRASSIEKNTKAERSLALCYMRTKASCLGLKINCYRS